MPGNEPQPTLAIIVPVADVSKPPTDPGYGIPEIPPPPVDLPGHPSHPIAKPPGGAPPKPDQGLPPGAPGHPDQGLPPIPTHPIVLPPGEDLPPGSIWPPITTIGNKSIALVWIPYHGWKWVVVDVGPKPKK